MDFTLMLITFINPVNYISQLLILLTACIVMAFGGLLEIKTEVVYPGDGIIVSLSESS